MKIHTLNDFITQMPKKLPNTIYQARWLYWQLGKRSFYDRKYDNFMFGEEEQYSIYYDKPYLVPNIVICRTLIKQYKRLLDMAHIKSEIIIDSLGHYSLVFYDENGKGIPTDLTHDLKNIQFNCSTSHFGKKELDKGELRNIDIQLGHITKETGYSNDYWHILRKRLKESSLNNRIKLEIALQSLQEFGDLSTLGESELFSMYEKFIKYCVDGKFPVYFYSTKTNNRPEEFYLELRETNRVSKYKLNKQSLKFELSEEIIREDIQL